MKPILEVSSKEKERKRKQWKINQRNRRRCIATANAVLATMPPNTPPDTPPILVIFTSRGRKKVRRERSKLFRDLSVVNIQLGDALRKVEKEKVRQTTEKKILTERQVVSSLTSDASTIANSCPRNGGSNGPGSSPSSVLCDLGLADIDVDSCDVSASCREKPVHLLTQYQSIFSKDKLDCGKASGCLHRIRLSDEKPFRMPYHTHSTEPI